MAGRWGAGWTGHRVLLALLILASACPVAAQDKKKRRSVPPAAASVPAAPAPVAPPLIRPAAPPQLRSAVRSTSSRTAVVGRSTTAQCRASCAGGRVSCLASPDDTSGCGPRWTQCLSDCAGLGYSRAPPR